MNKKYERSISTQRAESITKKHPYCPPIVLDPFPIVLKVVFHQSNLPIVQIIYFPINYYIDGYFLVLISYHFQNIFSMNIIK